MFCLQFFGTGSEDYYNYAWSSGEIFNYPYFGQPRNDGPANRGFVTNHRWHITDPRPFKDSIRFYMELYSHEQTPGMSYARIAYHYARPGISDDHLPITAEDVRHLQLPPKWEPAARMGAQNSIFMSAESMLVTTDLLSSDTILHLLEGPLWQGGTLLLWKPEQEGSQLELKLPVKEAGKYDLRLVAAALPTGGKGRVIMDGEDLDFGTAEGNRFHLPYRTILKTYSTKTMELSEGNHSIAPVYLGKSESSIEEPVIGLEFFWLQRR